MIAERVDILLQYVLLKAGEEDDFKDRDLGPIHLLKYVYLADLAYAKAHAGNTYTETPWVFYHFGPWSADVFQRIEPALLAIQADKRTFPSDYEDRENWVRWSRTDDRLFEERRKLVPSEICGRLDLLIHRYTKDTPALLDYVYRTAPMLTASPGATLDFSEEPPPTAAPAPLKIGQERTPHQLKKLREAARNMRLKYKEQPKEQNWFAPEPPPYDDVYEAGVAWLDRLAGESFGPGRLTVEFDPEIWTSQTRKSDALP